MEIAANPVTRDGKATTPITYDSNCLEEVCGSCAMIINDRARMACSALLDKLEQPIRLEPFSKFPVVRDLATDRSVIFEKFESHKILGPGGRQLRPRPGPRVSPEDQEQMYPLSRCISCCCCMEACPKFNEETGFVGAAVISQVRLFNAHPTGKASSANASRPSWRRRHPGMWLRPELRRGLPKDIPLTTSIAEVGGDVMKQALTDLFRK